jgi:hypothetical protein
MGLAFANQTKKHVLHIKTSVIHEMTQYVDKRLIHCMFIDKAMHEET